MLGWFKKKFGKKDKVEEQKPALQEVAQPPVPEEPEVVEEFTPEITHEAVLEEACVEIPEAIEVPAEPESATEPPAEEQAAVVEAEVEPQEPQPEEEVQLAAVEEEPAIDAEEIETEQEPAPALEDEPVAGEEEEEVFEATGESAISLVMQAVEEEAAVPDNIETAALQAEEPPKPKYQQPAEKPSMPKKNFEAHSRETSSSSGLFSRLSKRLSKTRESFTYQMDALFLGKKEIDSNLLDDLEEILILADLGVNTTQDLLEHARRKVKRKELKDPEALRQLLKDKISEYIVANDQDAALVMPDEGPFVIMVIGVNGVGKTTTIGKIAKKFINAGSSVILVAADTFRAAAIAQLQIWGDRNNVPVIAHKEGSDPSSVVYDGLDAALAQQVDVVLVDTAGRLHTKANLMEELKKIKRVMNKRLPGAPHETLLVIDATTGQNGVSQARLFNEAVEVTGLALTKLDGTSKGGIVANICKDLKIPIRFIGIGEQVDDLRDFEAGEFVDALFQARSTNE